MTRRLLLAYLTITAFALVVVAVPLGLTFAGRERDRLLFDLERDAQAVASRVEDVLEDGGQPDLADVFDAFTVPGGRIVVVDAEGRAVADSDGEGGIGRDFSTRPEIADALAGERVTGRRTSETLGVTLVFVAIPVASQGEVLGAVRITIPSETVDDRVRDTWYRLAALSGVVLFTVGAVGLILARGVTRPVRQVQEAAERLAAGDLTARAGDVTGAPELAALARQFDATAERLEQLVDAQARFVSDASHQLRTPLAALRLRLELAGASEEAPNLDAAIAEVDRLTRLVQSLLVLARTTEDAPEPVAIDVALVARTRHEALAALADGAGVTLAIDVPDQPVIAAAVEGAVEQVLDNLVGNAVRVAPPGSTIAISVTGHDEGGAQLEVIDEGPGMSPEQRAQATGRFWRAPDSVGSGSGLGLAIVDHLVLASGGQLTLLPGPSGRGLRAVVDLPAAPADS